MLLGSIEAGGTKFVCAVGNEDYRVIEKVSIPTTDPRTTFTKVINFFKQFEDLVALSIASFGPIEIQKNNALYGYITETPKKGWSQTNFVGPIKEALNIPVFFTTDVNGSAYGEYVLAQLFNEKIRSLVYLTIGTGVGGGAVIDGKIVGSQGHTEMGHVRVKRHPDDLTFEGICPFHQDCLEGLASGPTFDARLGIKGKDVPLNHPVWDILSYYVAQAAIQQTMILRPDNIVFGGGVVSEAFLEKVRRNFTELNNKYIKVPDLNTYIRMPRVKDNGSATLGNFALAFKELEK
ncbi:ROK family protein [Sporolactobacillus shoreicorticis]|uniref:fructokinase n=1 Tax=Sporolactobacillus shoreicorticis TaxID=1923877 RepID=A0ABW5S4K7_9BACL|nr:fructokinase ScrK [Sporolactobacillus shoreicorticis]MCO7124247.1 ROK family protein [Sporolactobacillus shoreicorticis]